MHDWSADLTGRVRRVGSREAGNDEAAYVLCWIRRTLRATDNPLIDAAVELGNALGLPVVVAFQAREDHPHASDRLHHFLLGGARDLQAGCAARGLRCVTHVERDGHPATDLLQGLARDAVAVLIDDDPLCFDWLERTTANLTPPVFAVETAMLVPPAVLPDGLTTTPAFRKANGALRPEYEAHATDFAPDHAYFDGDLGVTDDRLADRTDAELRDLVAACEIDHSLPPNPDFAPTARAAQDALDRFVTEDLGTYANRRNNPADEDGVSRLSPYLHFGMLGPRRIVRAVREADVAARARWKYLDELLTWREYFHYTAHRRADVTRFAAVPEKPRQSLLDHAGDERPVLHTLSQLVHGQTNDETWNAAQRQWLSTGYMHNNLRMYWGKQIIKWTADPETAWRTACYLNDRLSLDGRDPATYGNMRWVFGDARPAWKEQDVYGWVAPKSDRALRKRVGAAEWLGEWAKREDVEIDVSEGYPHDVLD